MTNAERGVAGGHLGGISSLGSTRLCGRETELAQLDELFQRAVDYHAPQLVSIIGPQGVGKTRLLGEWLQRLLERRPAGTAGRPRVYRGRGARGAGRYSIISRLLRDRFGILDQDDEARRIERVRLQLSDVFGDRRMTEVLHFLSRFLDIHPSENAFLRAISFGDDPGREEGIARSVLRRFLELDAERSPIILAFDDVHAADDDSLNLLNDLAHGLGGSAVVIVAAARPELFVRRPAWGDAGSDHTRIDLGPLARAQAEKLLRQLMARAEPLPATLVDDACDLTSGNPFFLEELVRVFVAQGIVQRDGSDDRWRLDAARAARVELPMSVEEAIEARIAALSPREREILERAASLGSVFWLGALVVLARLDATPGTPTASDISFSLEERARLEAVLEDMVERDYLLRMPDSTVPGEIEFVFKHNLEHDMVQRLVSPERARRYHLTVAHWLETRLPPRAEQSGEQLEFLGQLYEKGGTVGRAAEIYLAAADKARASYANELAIDLYQRALKLNPADDILWRLDPLHNHGDVLVRAGRPKEAMAAFSQMLEAAWRIDHHAKAGAAYVRLARLHRGLGEYAQAEKCLQRGLGLFRDVGDSRGVAAAEDDLGRVAFLRGDYSTALERHGRALDLRRALGDQRSIALSLHNLAEVHQVAGAPGEAVVRFSEALAIRREISDRPGVVQSLMAVAAAWRDREDYDRAHEVLTEALTLARDIDDRIEQAHILARLGELAVKRARDEEARAALREAAELARGFGDKLLQSEAARLLAEVYLQLGDLRQARDEARRGLELAERVGSRPAEALAHRILGTITSTGGITDDDRATADRHFQAAIVILTEVGHDLELGATFESYAHALTLRGELDAAATFAERAEEIAQRLGPRPRSSSRMTFGKLELG